VRESKILAGWKKVDCEGFTLDLTPGCELRCFLQDTKGYSVRMSVNKKKIEKGLNLSELSDPESLDGSPTDSETRKQEIKARETRLTRKQFTPQWSRQFCYQTNR
jgi:hypothetical protein